MSERFYLVISNPEHAARDFDTAARVLEFDADALEQKATYGIPEIWFVATERDVTDTAADTLSSAGFNVVVVESADLAHLPDPVPLKSFAFEDDELTITTPAGAVSVPYTSRACVVVGKPQDDVPAASGLGTRASRPSITGFPAIDGTVTGRTSSWALQAPDEEAHPFIDLYTATTDGIRRFSAVLGQVRFEGLGKNVRPRATDNLDALAEELVKRFPNAREDRRLVDMVLRHTNPPRPDDRRKGYSFATPALRELLEKIDPPLAKLSQPDLASRLTFLTLTRARPS